MGNLERVRAWLPTICTTDAQGFAGDPVPGSAYVIESSTASQRVVAAVRALALPLPLSRAHEHAEGIGRTERQETWLHRTYYAAFERDVKEAYEGLIDHVVAPAYGEDLVVQRVPTLRFQPPGGRAVERMHRDTEFGHQAGIVNY